MVVVVKFKGRKTKVSFYTYYVQLPCKHDPTINSHMYLYIRNVSQHWVHVSILYILASFQLPGIKLINVHA